jgi:transketolase
VGEDGDVVALERFGESAPAPALFEHFGFTPQAVAARAKRLVTASTECRVETAVGRS